MALFSSNSREKEKKEREMSKKIIMQMKQAVQIIMQMKKWSDCLNEVRWSVKRNKKQYKLLIDTLKAKIR